MSHWPLDKIYKALVGIGFTEFIRYFMAAGVIWLFFYVVRRRQWLPRKIIAKPPAWKDIRRELLLSALTSLIYAVVGLLTMFAIRQGWTQYYSRIGQYGWAWFGCSVVLTIFLHDAYFYWTHRMMHHPRLYPIMHKAHHRSVNPTPWAAYAFDPLEAVIQAAIFPLAVFLYPISPFAFLLFMVWQIGFNVIGHAGFEIYPHWLLKSWLGKFINTPTNHTMHHQYFRGNYGLYFNLWDRIMGTNHPDYEARFAAVTAKAEPEAEKKGLSFTRGPS